MQKPPYIEIDFPAHKGRLSSATKKYFKRLESKDLKLNFGEARNRKSFVYSVVSASVSGSSTWPSRKKTYRPKVVLRLDVEKTESHL